MVLSGKVNLLKEQTISHEEWQFPSVIVKTTEMISKNPMPFYLLESQQEPPISYQIATIRQFQEALCHK